MVNPVKIEYEKNDIYEKPDSDKLNFLIDIAFANHEQLVKQGLTLYGNGDPEKGLCSQLSTQKTKINWLVGILSAVGVCGMGAIVTLLIR
jgi:hypothetical protein